MQTRLANALLRADCQRSQARPAQALWAVSAWRLAVWCVSQAASSHPPAGVGGACVAYTWQDGRTSRQSLEEIARSERRRPISRDQLVAGCRLKVTTSKTALLSTGKQSFLAILAAINEAWHDSFLLINTERDHNSAFKPKGSAPYQATRAPIRPERTLRRSPPRLNS